MEQKECEFDKISEKYGRLNTSIKSVDMSSFEVYRETDPHKLRVVYKQFFK